MTGWRGSSQERARFAIRAPRVFRGHTDLVRSVAFPLDGTRILTASLDGTVRLWNLATGETIREYSPGLGALNTAIFGPEESTILCGGQHDTFVMLDIETGSTIARSTGHTEQIMALHLTPSGDVLSASQDTTIRRWSLQIAAQWERQRHDRHRRSLRHLPRT